MGRPEAGVVWVGEDRGLEVGAAEEAAMAELSRPRPAACCMALHWESKAGDMGSWAEGG